MSDRSSHPRVLVLMLTERCNFSCSFCGYRTSGGEMPFREACRLVAEAADLGVNAVVITGGEPLMHPRLHDLVAFCKARQVGVNITTNGWLVEREAARIAAGGADSVSFSLDGAPATHDRLRGRTGSYDAVIRGMEALAKVRPSIILNVNFVVTRENVRDLEPVFLAARAHGAEFNFWPVNNVPDLYLRPGPEVEAYVSFLERRVKGDPVLGPRFDFYRAAVDYHAKRGLRVRCLGTDDSLNVNWNGDLLPCCLWEDRGLVLGNAFERGLAAILHDPATRAKLDAIRREGCLDRCYNHALYEFSLKTGLPFIVG